MVKVRRLVLYGVYRHFDFNRNCQAILVQWCAESPHKGGSNHCFQNDHDLTGALCRGRMRDWGYVPND